MMSAKWVNRIVLSERWVNTIVYFTGGALWFGIIIFVINVIDVEPEWAALGICLYLLAENTHRKVIQNARRRRDEFNER